MIDRRFIALGAALGLIVLTAAPAVADSPRPPNVYETHVFISDQAGVGDIQDPNLVNGWGIVHGPTTPWWVANNGTNTSTLYNGTTGAPLPLVVKVPGAPTGTVFNGGTGFPVTDGITTAPARFLFAAEDGTISGWNPGVPATNPPVTSTQAFVVASHDKSIYKGLAIASWNGADYLYATDFHRGRVDVYDSSLKRKHWDGAFRDRHLPPHYAPFGIQAGNGMIFVTYARQDPAREDEIAGTGKGFVDAFDASRQAARPGRLAWRARRAVGHRLGAGHRLRAVQRRPDRRQLRQRPAQRLSLARWSLAVRRDAPDRRPQGDRRRRPVGDRLRQRRRGRPIDHAVLRRGSGRRDPWRIRGDLGSLSRSTSLGTRRVADRSPASSCIRIATQPRRRRCRIGHRQSVRMIRLPEPIPQSSHPSRSRRSR